MTIFDLPTLDPKEALSRVNATLDGHPTLREIYDDEFIADLIRRRSAHDNVLLLWLVQPEDELTIQYWDGVVNDLLTLAKEGAIDVFRAGMRKHDGPSMESVRTELFFAALLKRHGARVVLEPRVGRRKCEFMAETAIQTWWEVKTPLDLPELRQEVAVEREIQRRLRTIDQPYVLSLEAAELTREEVATAVKELKRELYSYYREGGKPPRLFRVGGLAIKVTATTRRSKGYLGTITGKPHVFQNEHSAHVVRRIIAAADQLPHQGGGIVVVDRSATDWIDHEDVVDACYGEERAVVRSNEWLNCRLPGLFDDPSMAHISAVVSYTRRWLDDDDVTMTVLHNPSAKITLPADFLLVVGVRHTRRIAEGRARFRLETTPDSAKDT